MTKNKIKNNYHFYRLAEIIGELFVLVLLITALTGGLRLVGYMLPEQAVIINQVNGQEQTIKSVSDYLKRGYIEARIEMLPLDKFETVSVDLKHINTEPDLI
ncbi:hypothetical protein ACFL04_03195 [Patescibacteria group bacterium]